MPSYRSAECNKGLLGLLGASLPPSIFFLLIGGQVLYDMIAITVGIMNSLDKPYRRSSDVLYSLRRDGAAWFVVSDCVSGRDLLLIVGLKGIACQCGNSSR